MIVTTTDFVPDFRISEIKKVIFSEQVISVNAAKDIMNGIKGIFGGSLESYSDEYKTVRENAVSDLKKQAEMLNGGAIIDLHISYGQFINSDMLCITAMAYGTVVDIERLND
ncbi:MAG: YbjQ family protein [Firmicutes bacterium]|nr:YbjQ family protein [Bacillota bacterium]